MPPVSEGSTATATVPSPLLAPRLARVQAVERQTSDTMTLHARTMDADWPPFAPGQFDMLSAIGVGEVPISVSGDPEHRVMRQYTIRAVGAVTRALAALPPGAFLSVRGPYGQPWPVDAAVGTDVLIIAGGLGLAPLRPAIHHVLAHRERYGRITLLYGARSPADLLFVNELQQWRGRFDVNVEVTVDAPTAVGAAVPAWRGRVGVVTTLLSDAVTNPDAVTALVCGPELMIQLTVRALREQGIGEDRIHVSLERAMACGVGLCGHCQLGPFFICVDGPVLRHDRIGPWLAIREL
jgi:NAD(P)H-flavin reductase